MEIKFVVGRILDFIYLRVTRIKTSFAIGYKKCASVIWYK